MKVSKILILGLVGASLSVTALASSIKDKLVDVGFAVVSDPAKVLQLKAMPELSTKPAESLTVFIERANVNNILITDYGGDIDLQVNNTKLAYRESNALVANFAKVQNQNFERMQLAS